MPIHIKTMKKLFFSSLTGLLGTILFISANPAFSQATPNSAAIRDSLPELGDPADRFLSPAQEIKLGGDFYRSLYQQNAIMDDPEIAYYILHLGNRLTSFLDTSKFKFTFFVVNDNNINAFAVPGGYIGVNAGLILESGTESQLAGVIAHEIAHVTQRHIARRLADSSSRQGLTLAAVLTGILMAAGGSGEAAEALIFSGIAAGAQQTLAFSRSNELEADKVGLGVLDKAGFDQNGMAEFFQILQRKKPEGAEQLAFLYTHPLDSERIAEAQSRVAQLKPKNPPYNQEYHLIKEKLRVLSNRNLPNLLERYETQKTKTDIQQYGYSQALAANGDFKNATAIIKNLIETDSDNLNYQLALARYYRDQKDYTLTTTLLGNLVTLYPDHYPLVFYYAESLKNLKQGDKCRTLIKTYLRSKPALTIQIHKLLAECHLQAGEPVMSNIALAEYYIASSNYADAIIQLQDALKHKNLDQITHHEVDKRLKEIEKMRAERRNL